MTKVYYNKKIWAKIRQGMIHIGQSQEITGVGLPLSPPSGVMQTAVQLPATMCDSIYGFPIRDDH